MGIFERADKLGQTLIPSAYCYGVKACESGEIIYFNPKLSHEVIDLEVNALLDQYEDVLEPVTEESK